MPQVKTLDYVMAIWLQTHIKEKNAHDVLYYNDQLITECPRANFFIVTRDGRVITPQKNILEGVIRKQILQLSGFNVEILEGDITADDLKQCKEAFLTSSTKNVLPVVKIDGQRIGSGKTGEITHSIYNKLLEEMYS